ncbi:uncharacterized protein LOC128206220 [Mya arenaria]|uniref:uncharacterized protein LOC128206220 n=1 Tax=Mya arenaria TaxID=6604 RepID=UPI0022E82A19|nr:uncharacterized protein LOC128206220 [Mya arenaria]XP_052764506.1 uncharacterized protein LOC128206220 [Mya arenaria]XP_052764507.1 uncharacterized protein LOC128206220 [Mya arenaria]
MTSNITNKSSLELQTPGRNLSRYDGNNTIITDGPFFDQMNKEQMEIFIYPFVLVIIYMVVGFIGNSIVIYIFTAKWKLTKTTVFILTLAGVDLMSCLINMPTEAAILWNPISFDNDIICKISRFTTFIASVSSSFVLVAISIDRYLMVCRPFLGRELDVKYAKKTCFVAVLLGLVTTWPSLIFYGTFTYHDKVVNSYTNELVTIETKTCLISNFYVENYKLPAGFYFFLFGGHVIMFVILTMLYLLIGRSLFMSTDGGKVTQEKRHSLKYFGLSIVSAFTGTVPNSPNDNRDKLSFGGRGSRAVSLENINRIEPGPRLPSPTQRRSTDTSTTVLVNDNTTPQPKTGMDQFTKNDNDMNSKQTKEGNQTPETRSNDCLIKLDNGEVNSHLANNRDSSGTNVSVSTSDDSRDTIANEASSKRMSAKLRLDMDKVLKGNRFNNSANGRLTSGSTASSLTLTPLSTTTPDSVRAILYRSQSVESRARLNRIIADELRHSEVKEFSLRSNTLMMRMVTIAFVISFFPYLVIVTLRYSNPDIPNKLGIAEQIAYHVFLRTYFINSMINPFIYGFMNMEFRAKLKELFCAFCTKYSFRSPVNM